MAQIGLRHPVFAKIKTETPSSSIVYEAGIVCGKAVSADISWTRQEKDFYGDDSVCESDNSVVKGAIKFGVDHLTLEEEMKLFGLEKSEENSGSPVYTETGSPAPYGGFGYIRVMRKAGVTSYRAFWLHKVQFGMSAESAKTKGESVEWGNPTVEGFIFGVYTDSTGVTKFRDKAEFSTYEAAETWLHAKGGIVQ